MAEVDYQAELKKIEVAVSEREAKRNQLQGLLEAKKAELAVIEEEIRTKFGCEPSELASKGVELKVELEAGIAEMKSKLGLT